MLCHNPRYATVCFTCAIVYTHVYFTVALTSDPEKSDRKLADRDVDFAFAAAVCSGPTLERIGTRQDHGEVVRRIISARGEQSP